MVRNYKPYIPKNIEELIDALGWMMLMSPKFEDNTGFFPGRNIDTAFFSLAEGMKNVRDEVGEGRFAEMMAMARQMRAHFEADPEDRTEESRAGRRIIDDMQHMLMRKMS